MKKLFLILLSALSVTAFADDVKIALLQPLTVHGSTACNPMEISMVRGELRKAFGWQSDFQVLTRLDVDAMLKEQGFQHSGMVDDAQRKKVGAMTGAQYICVSSITKYGTQLYIEAYLVDVETGQMTNPATQYANVKDEDYCTLPASCNALAKEMLGAVSEHSRRYVLTTDSIIDFGKIREEGGRVSHTFTLNVKIEEISDVQAACGCLVPRWSSNPSNPNQTLLTATYNPNGRPGRFTKTIVITLVNNAIQRLYVKGEVIPRQ